MNYLVPIVDRLANSREMYNALQGVEMSAEKDNRVVAVPNTDGLQGKRIKNNRMTRYEVFPLPWITHLSKDTGGRELSSE